MGGWGSSTSSSTTHSLLVGSLLPSFLLSHFHCRPVRPAENPDLRIAIGTLCLQVWLLPLGMRLLRRHCRLDPPQQAAQGEGYRGRRRRREPPVGAERPRRAAAGHVEEVAPPPLTPPPLPPLRYRRRTSSWARVWRPAPPRGHLFAAKKLPWALFLLRVSCVSMARSGPCFGPCALVPWTEPLILGSFFAYLSR